MKKLLRFLQILALALLWSSSYAQVPPYCMPAYTTGCTWGDGLVNFQLGTIDEPIPCSGTPAYYHDFTALSTDIDQGETVTLTVISGYSMHHVDVWIDFNDNNVFDASELVVDELVCTTTGVPYTTDITIPATAPTGPHSLRYRTNWLNAVLDPCVQYSYGNAADFTVNVVSGIPPVDIVTFDDNSQGQILNSERLCYLLFTMPNCVNYDLSELGANINALSDAGHIKASIYEGTTLLYTSGEIAVTGGVAEYVSISVPPGSLTLDGGASYKVAFMADPASPARIFFDAGVNAVNNGVATLLTTSASYCIYSGLTYPTFPEPLYYDGASYGVVSAVVKGYVASSGNTTGTDVQSACDSYTWIDGNTYTASNNTATHTLINAAGCDSLVTLDLTVNYSSAGTDTQVACDSYLWIDGNTYTSSNNTATHILSNAVGCDSVVTLDLTVNYSVVETATVLACDSAQVNGTWYYTSQQIIENYPGGAANGCDSTVITTLTIYPVFVVGSIADNQSICYNTTPTLLTGAAPTGGEAPYFYQWQNSTDNLTFTDIPGATSLDYQPGNMTGTTYYRMIQNPTTGCTPSLTLTLGTDNTTQGYPFYTHYMDSRTQMLYTADEIIAVGGSAGEISWIAYDVNVASSQTMNGFNIAMKNTTATTASSWDDNMTNLIDGTYTVPGTGWQQHTFTTPFVWDGVSNLLVSVCFDNNSYTNSSYVSSTYNAGMTRHYHYDGSSTSGCSATNGSSYDYRPNMKIGLTPAAINSTNTLTVTVFPEFVVGSITDDQTICYNTAPTLLTGTAPAGGNTPYNYQWQSSSDNVTFTDITGATSLDYQPSALAVTTYYRLNQSSASGCGMLTTNAVNITVIPDATCDAGINADICEGNDHTVSGTAANYSSVGWTTSGDGSFGNPNSLTSNYTPGAGDITAGSVTLSLTANPLSPCSTPALDDLVLTIQQPPTADAGADATICEDVTHTLTGVATNYQSLLWTSSGDGTFDDPTIVAATYTPGVNDIIAGTVNLTITSFAMSPCAVDASDNMMLTINLLAIADAGADATICPNGTHTLVGVAIYQQGVLWTTSGDGFFDDATSLTTLYTPGTSDISNETVDITLTAHSAAPCVDVSDIMVLSIPPDITAPVITSTHTNQNIIADANCVAELPDYTVDVIATDNCDPDLTITQSPVSGTVLSGAINTVTLTVTDFAGNFAEVTFNVAVVDHTPPDVTSSHPHQIVDANESCEAILPDYTGDVVATDNCSSVITIVQSPVGGTIISGTTNEVELRVYDENANTNYIFFNVTVVDNTDPTVICIEDQSVEADESMVFIVPGTIFDPLSTDDNCEVASVINDYNNIATLDGAVLPLGTTTITWTVMDNSGNISNCSFDVIVYTTVGVESIYENSISVYPNPTTGIVNLKFSESKARHLKISDLTGRIVYETNIVGNNESIDISYSIRGVYILTVLEGNKTVMKKIIKK